MSKTFYTPTLSTKAAKAETHKRRAANRRTRHEVHAVEAMYRYTQPSLVVRQAYPMPVIEDIDHAARLPKVEHFHTYGLKQLVSPLFVEDGVTPVIHRRRRNMVRA